MITNELQPSFYNLSSNYQNFHCVTMACSAVQDKMDICIVVNVNAFLKGLTSAQIAE